MAEYAVCLRKREKGPDARIGVGNTTESGGASGASSEYSVARRWPWPSGEMLLDTNSGEPRAGSTQIRESLDELCATTHLCCIFDTCPIIYVMQTKRRQSGILA